jgi:hypothetical protein
LTLEPRGDLAEALLGALCPGIDDLRESLGEDGLRLTREHEDGAVELACESASGFLARALHRGVELQRRGLGKAPGRQVGRPLQVLQLAPLDIGEAGLKPFDDVHLLALDAFGDPAVTRLEALVHLVDRAPAFRSMSLELGADGRHGRLGGPLELLSEFGERDRLEVSGLVDLLAIRLDSRLRLGDEDLLALPQLGELGRERLLRPLEIGGPARQPLGDALLGRRQAGAELGDRLAFMLDDGLAALLGDAALLLLETRERVGAFQREQPLDLGGARRRLVADQLRELVARPVELGLDVRDALGALSSA